MIRIPFLTEGLGVALALSLLWGGAQTVRLSSERTAHQTTKTDFAELRAKAEADRADGEAAERRKERQWSEKLNEVSNHAQTRIEVLQGDLASARTAADRLRIAARAAAAASASRASESPNPTGGGQGVQDPTPGDLLADVLQRHSVELVSVGEYADRLRVAGEACERSGDSITGTEQ